MGNHVSNSASWQDIQHVTTEGQKKKENPKKPPEKKAIETHFYDDLRRRADKHLALSGLLGVVDSV